MPPAERLDREIAYLKELGADSIQFYDHNFFDREEDMVPLLEVLARHELPWWCYARADALVNLSPETWRLVRKSRLRMAYIGAETPNDRLLKSIRKGTRSEQTLEVAEICRANGVIPELSFMVAPPEDPEGETERTFDFIRHVKRVNPQAEIIVYVYTPLPADSVPDSQRLRLAPLRDAHGAPVEFPKTPEEWTERRWVDYACHADAPWLSDRLRQRIRDFVTVLRCRFPTVQDTRSPGWAKGCAARPRELALCPAPLRRAMGAHGVAEPHRPARPAGHEPLSCGARPCTSHRSASSSTRSAARPQLLLRDWFPLARRRRRRRARQARASRSSRRAWSPARSCKPASRSISWRPSARALC